MSIFSVENNCIISFSVVLWMSMPVHYGTLYPKKALKIEIIAFFLQNNLATFTRFLAKLLYVAKLESLGGKYFNK